MRPWVTALFAAAALGLLGGCVYERIIEYDRVELMGMYQRADVEVDVGAVTLTGSNAMNALVDIRLEYVGVRPLVDILMVNGVAYLEGTCPNRNLHCEIDFDIVAPTWIDAELRTDVGYLSVCDLTGNVTATTTVGDIGVENISGDLFLESETGWIAAVGLGGERVFARTSTGNIAMVAEMRPMVMDADAAVGDIDLHVPFGAYDISAAADIGSVSVTDLVVDPNAPRRITATTDVGNITIDGYGPLMFEGAF